MRGDIEQTVVEIRGRVRNTDVEHALFGQSFASYKRALPQRPTAAANGKGRTKEIDNVEWYLTQLDRKYHPGMKTRCPLCREDGHDNKGDNLQIGENGVVHCWRDRDHGKQFHKHICQLKKESVKSFAVTV